ncbi:MAG: hypothetical protein Q9182_004428 [Xanthomendoza sp. 2 TL-2023]
MPIATKGLINGAFNHSHYLDIQDGPHAVRLKMADNKQKAPENRPVPPCRIFDYIKHQINTKPDAPALQYELNPAVSYAQLNKLTEKIARTVQGMQIDAPSLTPSALALLSASEVPSCLKQITTVGEPLSQDIADDWAEKIELRVSYGLGECAQLDFSTRRALPCSLDL